MLLDDFMLLECFWAQACAGGGLCGLLQASSFLFLFFVLECVCNIAFNCNQQQSVIVMSNPERDKCAREYQCQL